MVGIAHPLQRLTKQDGVQDGCQKLYVSICQELYVIEQLFSRYRDETLQVRHRLPGTGRGRVDDSTVSPRGVRNKGLITQKREFDMHSHSFQDEELKLHRNVDVSPGQVVEGLTIVHYPQRGQK